MKRPAWGKFNPHANTRHHLAHHCADVAACFRQLCALPVIRHRLERAAGVPLTDIQIERLTALVFLHDAGKLHPGFQARGWPEENWGGGRQCGHVFEGLELFLACSAGDMLPMAGSLHVKDLVRWGVNSSLLRSVISHHGRPANADSFDLSGAKKTWSPRGPYDPAPAAEELGRMMPLWFPDAFERDSPALPIERGQFEHFICGLVTLADWLGSSTDWCGHIANLDENYIEIARENAAQACADVGLDTIRQRTVRRAPIDFATLTTFPKPNPQQSLVGQTNLNANIVILEAETGSGKTEAALWHYMRLFEDSRVDGLYFAVPTRAAAVQLQSRINAAAQRVFSQAAPEVVLAIPGYIKVGEVSGKFLPHWRVLWDDAANTREEKQRGRWAAEHSKRFLATQIAVGTVDQAMMGALTFKHAHLRAASLSRSLLVIDEVHASDAYMTSVQKALLDGHVAVGGYAMLMSATLGSVARSKWLGHDTPDFGSAVALPYPAVWTSLGSAARSPQTSVTASKHVDMETLPTMAPEKAAEQALACARRGARVLIVRNTVDRAVETLRALEAITEPSDRDLFFRVGDVATLHHSRFAPTDRKLLDQAVEDALSARPDRAPMGRLIIGTQTLEQSLDIDADLLVTDLCPVDVLLQRIGRLHRHKLARPKGFESPHCVVMVPEAGLVQLLDKGWRKEQVRTAAPGLGTVYRDISMLELTRRLIAHHTVWEIPAMNRQLVEAATHPEAVQQLLDELGADWERDHQDLRGGQLAEGLTAQGVLIDRSEPFEDCRFPQAAEEKIRTRLGDDTVRITLAKELPTGPFGKPVSEVVLPSHWCRDQSVDDTPATHANDENGVLITVGEATFRYDRFGLAAQG